MICVRVETPADQAAIDQLLDSAFGPGREAKVSYRFREDVDPVTGLCLVAVVDGRIRGTIRFWPVIVGHRAVPALLLGPVAVDPDCQGVGIGSRLICAALTRARSLGHRFVMLVGSPGYYARFGFVAAAPEGIIMVDEDPARLQVLKLDPTVRLPRGEIGRALDRVAA